MRCEKTLSTATVARSVPIKLAAFELPAIPRSVAVALLLMSTTLVVVPMVESVSSMPLPDEVSPAVNSAGVMPAVAAAALILSRTS